MSSTPSIRITTYDSAGKPANDRQIVLRPIREQKSAQVQWEIVEKKSSSPTVRQIDGGAEPFQDKLVLLDRRLHGMLMKNLIVVIEAICARTQVHLTSVYLMLGLRPDLSSQLSIGASGHHSKIAQSVSATSSQSASTFNDDDEDDKGEWVFRERKHGATRDRRNQTFTSAQDLVTAANEFIIKVIRQQQKLAADKSSATRLEKSSTSSSTVIQKSALVDVDSDPLTSSFEPEVSTRASTTIAQSISSSATHAPPVATTITNDESAEEETEEDISEEFSQIKVFKRK